LSVLGLMKAVPAVVRNGLTAGVVTSSSHHALEETPLNWSHGVRTPWPSAWLFAGSGFTQLNIDLYVVGESPHKELRLLGRRQVVCMA
jgi:hypothetical protein